MNLISGKEAKLAWAKGGIIQVRARTMDKTWSDLHGMHSLDIFDQEFSYEFRLKPRTITLNGIEVPAPFEPKEDCQVWIIDDGKTDNCRKYNYEVEGDERNTFIGMWRTEEEIRQVVDALRKVFKEPQQ